MCRSTTLYRAPHLSGRNVNPVTQRVTSSLSMTATLEPKVRAETMDDENVAFLT